MAIQTNVFNYIAFLRFLCFNLDFIRIIDRLLNLLVFPIISLK